VLPSSSGQQGSLKRWYPTTTPRGAATKKTTDSILKTSNLAEDLPGVTSLVIRHYKRVNTS